MPHVEKTMARGERLEQLDEKSERLEQGAMRFQKGAKKLKWSERCKSYRNCAIILVLLAVCTAQDSLVPHHHTSLRDSSKSTNRARVTMGRRWDRILVFLLSVIAAASMTFSMTVCRDVTLSAFAAVCTASFRTRRLSSS